MATLASLVVKIMADTQQFVGQLDLADKQVQRFGRKMDRVGQQLQRGGASLTAGLTLPLVGLGVAASKTAIDFESSFAGIRKTMDMTEGDFDRLAQANRNLAKSIPVSVNEINRIGELAGQLGIRGVENVVKFEDTIAKLAVTTDLTADDAALSFAQIAAVIQLPQNQIDRLGASVVGLGNNFQTTESRIVEFTSRIAGAGKIARLSAGDLTGLATGFSSLGVEAEAGGTAVQKVLLSMVEASTLGGDALAVFARTAGMSAQEFRLAFRDDAGGAFVEFVEGLGDQGDKAIATLNELGLTDQRLTRAFLAAAGAGDLLRRTVEMGNEEFDKNTALQDEAAKRFETRASQIRVRVNQIQDALISLGIALFPVLDAALAAVGPAISLFSGLAHVFSELPAPLQFVVLGFVGLLAAIGPVVFIAGSFATALSSLIAIAPIAAGGIGGITLAVKGLTLALASNPVTLALVVGSLAVGALAFGKFKGAVDDATEASERFDRVQALIASKTPATLERELEQRQKLRFTLLEQVAAMEAAGVTTYEQERQLSRLFERISLTESEIGVMTDALAELEKQEKITADQAAAIEEALGEFGAAANDAANDIANLTPRMVASAAAARIVAIQMNNAIPAPLRLAASMLILADTMDAMREAAAVQAQYEGLISVMFALSGVTDDATASTSGLSAAHKEAEKAAKDAAKAQEEAAARVARAAEEAARAMDALRQQSMRQIDTLGRALVTALQRQHQQELDSRLATLEAERIAVDGAYAHRLSLIEGEKNAALAALDAQLAALDEAANDDRLRELQERLALAWDPREQADIQKQITEFERQQQRARLQVERQSIEERFRDRATAVEDEQRQALAALDQQTEGARAAYAKATEAWRLESKARELIAAGELDTIEGLLAAHVPEWVTYFQTFSEQVVNGPLASLRNELSGILSLMGAATGISSGAASTGAAVSKRMQAAIDQIAAAKVGSALDQGRLPGLRSMFEQQFGIPAPLADGAYITQPTFAYLGETPRARPEIVSPEPMLRRIVREESGGGRGVIELHNYTVLDGAVIDHRVERVIADATGQAAGRGRYGA